MNYIYVYPRPMVTTDIIILSKKNDIIEVLLIKRLNSPFENRWALPGGFVDKDEDLVKAASRELFEETGISQNNLIQFYTFGKPGRDPRGHCISIVYYAFVDKENISAQAGDDAKELAWYNINSLPELAFDHQEIIIRKP